MEKYIIDDYGQMIDPTFFKIENDDAVKLLNDQIIKIETKQTYLAAALVMIKTMHRQPCELKEILLWLVEYSENKENEEELMAAYDIVNFSKNYKGK